MPSLSAATAPGWSPARANSDTMRNGDVRVAIAVGIYRPGVTSIRGQTGCSRAAHDLTTTPRKALAPWSGRLTCGSVAELPAVGSFLGSLAADERTALGEIGHARAYRRGGGVVLGGGPDANPHLP